MQITTYQSIKAWPEKRWLASLDIGNNLLMSFFAKTEQEAIDAANRWWDAEVARQTRLGGSPAFLEAATDEYRPSKGKGSHLIGIVWMIHTHTREKIRVQQSEVTLYEGRGYVKGGPRSK